MYSSYTESSISRLVSLRYSVPEHELRVCPPTRGLPPTPSRLASQRLSPGPNQDQRSSRRR